MDIDAWSHWQKEVLKVGLNLIKNKALVKLLTTKANRMKKIEKFKNANNKTSVRFTKEPIITPTM